jgi:iron complex outermembrane receptor protein
LLGTFTDSINETEYYNAGGAIYKGIEGEGSYLLTDNLSIFANGSYNDATSTTTAKQMIGSTAAPTDGFAVKGAPRGTAAVGLLYRSQDWTASISDKYVGVSWWDNYQSDKYKVPGYNQTDVKVTRNFGHVRLEASIYDLFNSQAVTSIKPNKQSKLGQNIFTDTQTKNIPYDQYYYQPGRSFQVGLRVNF